MVSNRPSTSFLPDTEGVNIHANVAPRAANRDPEEPNSFRGTTLLEHLRDSAWTTW